MIHRHVGFLEDEESLRGVDEDFRELVKISYAIPGFGSYGVSCSGHFCPEYSEDRFWPEPWGSLGIATLPEMKHIPELLRLIYDSTQTDSDAHVGIQDLIQPPMNYKKYSPDIDLKPYSYGKTDSGLYVALLDIRFGDNGCLDSCPEHYCSPIKLAGNQEAFEKSQKRCLEIKQCWKMLEGAVREYTKGHGFSKADYHKREFEPFA